MPNDNQTQLVHGRLDDLESFYHVLLWVSLQHARHGISSLQLYDDLIRLFDHALIDGDKAYSNSSKLPLMESTMMLEMAEFQNPPLLELLLKLSLSKFFTSHLRQLKSKVHSKRYKNYIKRSFNITRRR